MSTHEDGKDIAPGASIPEVSPEELATLGISDLPTPYYTVTGLEAEKPIFEIRKVDNTLSALSKLTTFDRAMLKESLLARAAFVRDRDALLRSGGLGYPERMVSSMDLAIVRRLSPELQSASTYEHLSTTNPHGYLTSYGSKPQVGDVILPFREHTGRYSTNPNQYVFTPLAENLFENPTSPESFKTRIVAFRPQLAEQATP